MRPEASLRQCPDGARFLQLSPLAMAVASMRMGVMSMCPSAPLVSVLVREALFHSALVAARSAMAVISAGASLVRSSSSPVSVVNLVTPVQVQPMFRR